MDEDQDLERCNENRGKATRGDRRQRGSVNSQRYGTRLCRRRIIRVRAFTAGTAKLATELVPMFGLLFSLFSILITLMQIKYLNGDTSPYITNPSSMAICLVALCIFAFAVGFKMIRLTLYGNLPAHITDRVILISGVLVIVAIVSIIVTNRLSWIIYIIWAIFSVMVVAWNWIHIINQWRLYERTENAFFGVINVFRRFKQRLPMINAGRKLLVEPQGPSNV